MSREEDILQMNRMLYEKLVNTPDIDGTFELDGFSIVWRRNCEAYLNISWDTIHFVVGRSCLFHWHPDFDYADMDEFYHYLLDIGKKGNVLVIGNRFFYQHIRFIGSAEEYFSNKKLFARKRIKYIFGDKMDIQRICRA